MENKDEKEKSVLDILSEGLSEKKDFLEVPLDELPVPEGLTSSQVEATISSRSDDGLYSYKELTERLSTQDQSSMIPTFFDQIDEMLGSEVDEKGVITKRGGLKGGELVIWSGPTKSGKSTSLQAMSYLQAKNGFPTLWFSLEMSWQELTEKFKAMDKDSRISGTSTDLPLYYPIDTRYLSLEWLEDKIKKAKEELNVCCVYIDHLHFLLSLKDNTSNVSFTIGSIVREIKRIAVRNNIPIFLICHTKKIDVNTVPDINSVRDSSFVAQESDFTFIIWRVRKDINTKKKKEDYDVFADIGEDVYTNLSVISLEANRRTGKTKKMLFGMEDGMFYPCEEYYNIVKSKGLDESWEIKKLEAYKERLDWKNI